MPASLQDHCHLDTSWPPSATYALRPGKVHADVATIEASAARAISGLLRVQVLSDHGVPVKFADARPVFLVTDHAELLQLISNLGREMYYTPNFHDDVSSLPGILYTRKVLFKSVDAIEAADPYHDQYYSVQVELVDVYSKTERIYDTEQGTLSYATNSLADTSQDFDDWEAGANPEYYVVVTHTDGTIGYAYLGASSTTSIALYKDYAMTLAGLAGVDHSGKTPQSYEVRKVAFG